VQNNLANSVAVRNFDPYIEADHNVGIATAGAVFAWYVNGVAKN
jgi:hypothetical protein